MAGRKHSKKGSRKGSNKGSGKGSNKRHTKKGTRKVSAWNRLVKKVKAEHPNWTLPQASSYASKMRK